VGEIPFFAYFFLKKKIFRGGFYFGSPQKSKTQPQQAVGYV